MSHFTHMSHLIGPEEVLSFGCAFCRSVAANAAVAAIRFGHRSNIIQHIEIELAQIFNDSCIFLS